MIDTNNASPAWFLVYTKAKQEQLAAEQLRRQAYTVFLPKVKKKVAGGKSKIEAMFPRYLFIKLSIGVDNWSPIRSTIGVSNLVKFGLQPASISEELISAIKHKCDENAIFELPDVEFNVGDNVRVCEGVFNGYEAVVTARTGKQRVELLLKQLNSPARLKVSTDYLEHVVA